MMLTSYLQVSFIKNKEGHFTCDRHSTLAVRNASVTISGRIHSMMSSNRNLLSMQNFEICKRIGIRRKDYEEC
jgi:hypothetical protein